MGFEIIRDKEAFAELFRKVTDVLDDEGVLYDEMPEGPKQYPALVAHHITNFRAANTTDDRQMADIIFAYVYSGDCASLLSAVNPEEAEKNLKQTGHLWAAEMIRQGYKDGDGPARFISQKLFSNLWQFLQELRTLIPAFIKEPAKVERGIDCVILLETLVKRCTEDGDAMAEESIKPMLTQLSVMAEENIPPDARKQMAQQLAMQIRQLQALAVAADKKSATGSTDVRVRSEEAADWGKIEEEDNFRRDISAKVMAIWSVLTTISPAALPMSDEGMMMHFTKALRNIDEEMTRRKSETTDGGTDV